MMWWGWLIFGLALMGMEMFVIDAAFYLIFIGLAAVCTGLLELAGITLPMWGQWLVFAVLALVLMVLFRQKLYKKLRGGLPGFDASSTGQRVTVPEDLPAGGETRVRLRGSDWTAQNVGDEVIEKGSSVPVISTEGLILKVKAPESPKTSNESDKQE